MDVGTDNIDDRAESRAVLLDDVEWLGGGDWSSVASGLELTLDVADEAGETRGRHPASEDVLVTDDNHGDNVPVALTPCLGVSDLLVGVRANTRCIDVDSNEHLHSIGAACTADVRETRAVIGVCTDGGEALALERGDVAGDLVGSLTVSGAGVWRVAESPLVAIC